MIKSELVERVSAWRSPLIAAVIIVSVGAAQATGNVAAGKARAFVCAGCHGTNGEGVPPTPRLAGVPEDQQVQALKDYKSGARANAAMKGLAASLSEKDMKDLSAYFASLPFPPPSAPPPAASPPPTPPAKKKGTSKN
jgi:cytochrome c553